MARASIRASSRDSIARKEAFDAANSLRRLQSRRVRANRDADFKGGFVDSLPSLIRFLIVVGALVAIAYGIMVALVAFVTPQPREMTYTIPAQRLNK
jgi:hypothetical protein